MRETCFIFAGFCFLTVASTFATILSFDPYVPNLLLPLVVYLGVSSGGQLWRRAFTCFVLGFLADLFSGRSLGLQTLVLVGAFLVAWSAGLRIFLRSPVFQFTLTFVAAALANTVTLALRALFEPPVPFAAGSFVDSLKMVTTPAIATALTAPLVFLLAQKIDASFAVRHEPAIPGT